MILAVRAAIFVRDTNEQWSILKVYPPGASIADRTPMNEAMANPKTRALWVCTEMVEDSQANGIKCNKPVVLVTFPTEASVRRQLGDEAAEVTKEDLAALMVPTISKIVPANERTHGEIVAQAAHAGAVPFYQQKCLQRA